MKILRLVLLYCAVLPFVSCNNDIKVNANWKEIAVVYGLLDLSEPIQYIRIERAYLNEGTNALLSANQADSIYFKNIRVRIIREDAALGYPSIELHLDTLPDRKTGLFANSPNLIWYTDEFVQPFASQKATYTLEVTNLETGTQFKGQTKLVYPSLAYNPQNFDITPTKNTVWRIITGKNGRMYDMFMQFNYREYNQLTGDSNDAFVTWPVNIGNYGYGDDGGELLLFNLNGEPFFDFLSQNILPKPGIDRRAISVDMIYYGGSQELFDYINLNKPSLGIVQKKPEYSNISNGLGIFSSRQTNRQLTGLPVTDSTETYLHYAAKTSQLNFLLP